MSAATWVPDCCFTASVTVTMHSHVCMLLSLDGKLGGAVCLHARVVHGVSILGSVHVLQRLSSLVLSFAAARMSKRFFILVRLLSARYSCSVFSLFTLSCIEIRLMVKSCTQNTLYKAVFTLGYMYSQKLFL